jgi:O-antigen ligase
VRWSVRNFLAIPLGWNVWKGVVVAALVAGICGALYIIPRPSWKQFAQCIGSLYLVTLAVGVGGFFGSHMLFALPLYCAFFFVFLFRIQRHDYPVRLQILGAILLLFTVVISLQKNHYADLRRSVPQNSRSNIDTTLRFDSIIRSCKIEKFFNVGDTSYISAYTAYSPIGPLAFHLPFMADDHPMLWEYYKKGLETADMALATETARNIDLMERLLLEAGFTNATPECAKPYQLPEKYQLYYRLP